MIINTGIMRADVTSAGCWIGGHWGRFGTVRVVQISVEYGRTLDHEDDAIHDRLLAELNGFGGMGPGALDSDWDALHDQHTGLADQAEQWLNQHVAPEGFYFGWHDGEFFLWPLHAWHDDDPGACECSPEQIEAAEQYL